MKIYLKLSSGAEFHLQRERLEDGKFYALVILAAIALFVTLLLGSTALKYLR